jgi:uncharacterized protein YbjT (DUF2867 family)
MKIAVVGATGNIGARLCRKLLVSGHQVRALSRGGRGLDELVKLGAEPFLGSFDTGTSNVGAFFSDADAAFTMVKSDFSNLRHYRTVAPRLAEALQGSSVGLVINLSAYGAELGEGAAHFSEFYRLEQALNRISGVRMVHLRAGWFMENHYADVDSIARYGRMASLLRPDLKIPFVATRDIADVAAREFLNPVSAVHTVREVRGSEDLSMSEAAALISSEIGRPVEAICIDPDKPGLKEEYLRRFGTAELWEHRLLTYATMNAGRVRFHEPRSPANSQPTRFGEFLRTNWRPVHEQAVAHRDSRPETFETWVCQ